MLTSILYAADKVDKVEIYATSMESKDNIVTASGEVTVVYPETEILKFAVEKLEVALGQKVLHRDISLANKGGDVFVTAGWSQRNLLETLIDRPLPQTILKEGGFEIVRGPGNAIYILGTDANGAMYGVLDLAEQIAAGNGLAKVKNKVAEPKFEFRAIKFNLPWYSYRTNDALSLHSETCRDLEFWGEFLDMMAENRGN